MSLIFWLCRKGCSVTSSVAVLDRILLQEDPEEVKRLGLHAFGGEFGALILKPNQLSICETNLLVVAVLVLRLKCEGNWLSCSRPTFSSFSRCAGGSNLHVAC
ncbi:hypothetical protein M758_8G146900 [Ceratodon purpureus]|nr:hypothetical protein M758_8G146900 [Ceratodon purpureus]